MIVQTQLSTEMVQYIKKNPLIDIHSHFFNYEYIMDGYLGLILPFNRQFLRFLAKTVKELGIELDIESLKNDANFIRMFRQSSMEEIFLKRISYETDSIHVPLMMDTSMAVKGKMKRTIREQMEDLRDLRNKYPERILPFVSIDPNNPEAFQLFSDAFDSEKDFKFWGVKIYPCLGYLPSHPVLMKIFKICEECNIPIITHGSSVATKPKYKKSHIYGLELDRDGKIVPVDKYVKLRTKNDWKFFNDPKNWIPVLEAYPNLRLDLAHFGGDEFLKFGTLQRNWVVDIIDMLLSGKYPNLYTDFSYTLYDSRKYIKLKQLLLDNPKILDRVLFGTDFFMILLEGSFRVIRTNFITYMGEILMDKIGKTNNRKFLFP